MKKLRELQGGYPRRQDYLLTLQRELLGVADALYAKLGVDMILQGCDVTNNGNGTVNISAGVAYVGGEVLRFDGAGNVTANGSKTFVKASPINSDASVFADGQTRELYSEVKVIIGNKSNNAQIAIGLTLYSLKTYIQDVVSGYAFKGEIKDVHDIDNTFLENFDASGLGVSARYSGWALCNGNNGTPNYQGRVRLTAGNIMSDGIEYTFPYGSTGGSVKHKLVNGELPQHDHYLANENGETSTGQKLQASGPYRFLERFFNSLGDRNYTLTGNSSTPNVGRTSIAGGDLAHNNMQPYINVYTIIRIS